MEVDDTEGTILVAKDDASLRTLIAAIVEGAGYQALVAASGAEACPRSTSAAAVTLRSDRDARPAAAPRRRAVQMLL